jgi:hypothetical protein
MDEVRLYCKDLPIRLQELALSYCNDRDRELFATNTLRLSASFEWRKTKEGYDFWNNVFQGVEIPKEYFFSEEQLFDEVSVLISKAINNGK